MGFSVERWQQAVALVEYYRPTQRHERAETCSDANVDACWHRYPYAELMARGRDNLDVFWLRDGALEDSARGPEPEGVGVATNRRGCGLSRGGQSAPRVRSRAPGTMAPLYHSHRLASRSP